MRSAFLLSFIGMFLATVAQAQDAEPPNDERNTVVKATYLITGLH